MKQCYAVLLAVCLVMGSISPALAVEEVVLPKEQSQTEGQDQDSLDSHGEQVDGALLPAGEDKATEPSTGENDPDAEPPLDAENGGSSGETPPMEGDSTTEPPTGAEEMLPTQQPEVPSGEPTLPTQQPNIPPEELPLFQKAPTLQLNLVEENGVNCLYGTLSNIPEHTVKILVLYSFGSEQYTVVTNTGGYGSRAWDLRGLEEGTASLTQLCMGENDSPLKAYLGKTVNTLSVKLQITQMTEEGSVETETEACVLSNHLPSEVPEIPPAFTASIETSTQGYLLMGTFTEFLPSTVCVRPMYSLDGETYQVISEEEPYDWLLHRLGTDDEAEFKGLSHQICAGASVEPLKSYLAGEIPSFYTKLRITLEDGASYDTKAFQITRGLPLPLPDGASVAAIFPSSMRVIDKSQRPAYAYGKYQMTVREDASTENIYATLPKTVPVELQITFVGDSGAPIVGCVEVPVSWKEQSNLHLTAGETLTIENAAEHLLIPAGTQVHTPLGEFILPDNLSFDGVYSRDNISLVLNVIAKDEKAEVSLRGSLAEDATVNKIPLSLAFSKKPSGATSIRAYAFAEGDEQWTELCDLLTLRAVDANQAECLYGYVDVLQPTDSSYQKYLQGEVSGCLVALVIKGGVYDGEIVMLPWPGEYNPPPRIPEIEGSGGNENNAGSGGGNHGGSTGGGQRPDLPDTNPPSSKPDPEPIPKPDVPGLVGGEEVLPPENPDTAKPIPIETVGPQEELNTDLNGSKQEKEALVTLETPREEPNSGAPNMMQLSYEVSEPGDSPSVEMMLEPKLILFEAYEQVSTSEQDERTPQDKTGLPQNFHVGVLAVGTAAAIGFAAVGSVSTSGMMGKLVALLKRKFF